MYCKPCFDTLSLEGFRDPVEDVYMLLYLCFGTLPDSCSPDEMSRVSSLAHVYKVGTNHAAGGRTTLFALY